MNALLKVASRKIESGILIEAIGEVDLATVKSFAEILAEGVQATVDGMEAHPLSVDLRQVDFIDSAGLAVLVGARKQLAPAGRCLRVLVTQGQQPDRVLKAGRFNTIMSLHYDFDEL